MARPPTRAARPPAGAARRSWALLAALLGGAACGQPSLSEPERLAQAQQAVRRFFAAVEAGSCEEAKRLVEGGDCQMLEDLRRRGFQLVEVTGAQRDGRNPEAVIVRARIGREGKTRDVPMLVERRRDGWRLRL